MPSSLSKNRRFFAPTFTLPVGVISKPKPVMTRESLELDSFTSSPVYASSDIFWVVVNVVGVVVVVVIRGKLELCPEEV